MLHNSLYQTNLIDIVVLSLWRTFEGSDNIERMQFCWLESWSIYFKGISSILLHYESFLKYKLDTSFHSSACGTLRSAISK